MTKNMPGSIRPETVRLLADITTKIANGAISHQELEYFAKRQNPFEVKMDTDGQLASWKVLLKELFDIEIDMASIKIPEQQVGFDRLIVVPKGLTLNQIIAVCRLQFDKVYCYSNDLNNSVAKNDRTNTETYAVWVCDRVEADEELKNLSANQIEEQGVTGITLMERLLQELKYFSETKKHLDVQNVTLCTGSRYSDGSVPYVHWITDYRRLSVGWCYADGSADSLRSRAVVS